MNKNVQNSLDGRVIGRAANDHTLSIDMAKHLAMIQRTDKGRQVRQYFIECEKRFCEQSQVSGTDLNLIQVNGNRFSIPAGSGFSVSVSQRGAVTVRVKEPTPRPASTPTKSARLSWKQKRARDIAADPVTYFVKECCELDPQHCTTSDDLWNAWREWSARNGISIFQEKAVFFRRFNASVKGFPHNNVRKSQKYRGDKRAWAYRGIALHSSLVEFLQ